jgi:hypothetical protein
MKTNNPLKIIVYIIACFLIAMTFSACAQNSNETKSQSIITIIGTSTISPNDTPVAPANAPFPEEGKASISGALFSFTIHRIIPETTFYLTPGIGKESKNMPVVLIGPDTEHGDIRGFTDSLGKFEMNNISPGNYYLIVWAPYNWEPAVGPDEEHKPFLIELKAGDREALGVLYVSWP